MTRALVLFLAGGLMVAASFAHALAGWPHLKGDLEELAASVDLSRALAIGWHWGSATMAALGIMTIAAGWRRRRGERSGVLFARLAGACWILFGAATMARFGFSGHFMGFLVIGALAWAPTLMDNRPL